MSKGKKIAIIVPSVAVGLAVIVVLWLMLCGYLWTWGPFSSLANIRFAKLAGNSDEYSVENVSPLEDSPLEGANILYLGSSVTYGASSLQTASPEYIARRNSTTYVKEAVSGTTLTDGVNSYISRLKSHGSGESYDLFVCQLSTNDASQNRPLGALDSYDTGTVCGAINTIIDYAKDMWGCPVVFYTNAYYNSEAYAQMVEALNDIAAMRGIYIIDMYSDGEFNDISAEEYELYMADEIHPTRAGYLEWWTPYMEAGLYSAFEGVV